MALDVVSGHAHWLPCFMASLSASWTQTQLVILVPVSWQCQVVWSIQQTKHDSCWSSGPEVMESISAAWQSHEEDAFFVLAPMKVADPSGGAN